MLRAISEWMDFCEGGAGRRAGLTLACCIFKVVNVVVLRAFCVDGRMRVPLQAIIE